MRLIRFAAVLLLAAAGGLAFATPAQAGGWATTLLDPLPDRLEPGQTYTIGYWVLQHGSHPYEGDLGLTGLRLTDATGASVTHHGTALPERAHYAAAVVFSGAGTWQLTAVQGIFADYEIGAAIVPGAIALREIPPAMTWNGEDYWSAIRPPLSGEANPAPVAANPAPVAANPAAAVNASNPAPSGGWSIPAPLVLAIAVAAAGVASLLTWLLRPGLSNSRVHAHRTQLGATDSGIDATLQHDRVGEPVR
jgi:hypothetical protein